MLRIIYLPNFKLEYGYHTQWPLVATLVYKKKLTFNFFLFLQNVRILLIKPGYFRTGQRGCRFQTYYVTEFNKKICLSAWSKNKQLGITRFSIKFTPFLKTNVQNTSIFCAENVCNPLIRRFIKSPQNKFH